MRWPFTSLIWMLDACAGDGQRTEQHAVRDVPGHPHPAGVGCVSLLARDPRAPKHSRYEDRVRSGHRFTQHGEPAIVWRPASESLFAAADGNQHNIRRTCVPV